MAYTSNLARSKICLNRNPLNNRKLNIVQEGPGYIVVNKPAGITTEAYREHDTLEARAWVHFQRPGSPKKPYVGIVHRLDRPVSGALLIARNISTLRRLNQAFAEKKVSKHYLALTQVPLPGDKGTLRHYLSKDLKGKRAVVSTGPAEGAKSSSLNYRLLNHDSNGYLYQLEPITGRYHQIRAQLSAAGAPIIGDLKYGSEVPFQPNQIMLHAYQLEFPGTDGTNVLVQVDPTW